MNIKHLRANFGSVGFAFQNTSQNHAGKNRGQAELLRRLRRRSGTLQLLCLGITILAASLHYASCQVSYCIVGYANVLMVPGYNFAANPFDLDGTNALANVLNTPCAGCTNGGVPDGTKVYVWDVIHQVFWPPATLSSGTWDTNFYLPPGKGFVILATAAWTNTFVGRVDPCPGQTNGVLIVGGNRLSFVASMLPASGSLTNSIFNFQATDGDQLTLYAKQNQIYSDAFCYFSGYGWYDPNGTTNGPVLAIGQSFFIQHPGSGYYWTQYLPSQEAMAIVSSAAPPARISSISIKNNKVILQVTEIGSRYNVQFSPDRTNWTTIASNRAGPIWIGSRPSNPQGYFRVIETPGTKGAL